MDEFSSLLRKQLDGGASLEEALGYLRNSGSDPISTIKAVREVLGVGLGEAKRIFDTSLAWQLEAQAGRKLHEEIIKLLEDNNE